VRLSAQVATAVLLVAATSQAAYQYIHYPSRTNFTPVYEKFNVDALPNKTVTFYVGDQAPNLYPNNEFGSVLSQVKQALAAWNSVSVSDLRVAFGGMQGYTANPSAASPGVSLPGASTPGGDILFVDTPGVLGLSAPSISTVPVQGSNGQQFFPIVRGLVMISRDTTEQPWPSAAETFFATAVHEIGHALGLQHTWTGSAMSQGVIRTTSRARPLDADDIAALATLYGKSGWRANYGTITGQVSFPNNSGVTLGSVVAIAPNGPAVSALTHPDGSYRIEGVPAGYAYNVYVHALPPDAVPADGSGLRRPVDNNNQPFNASGPFQTLLYDGGAGTLDPQRAVALNVAPGSTFNINFTVQPRASVRTYNVQTYSRITTATREWGAPGDASVLGYPGFINTTLGKSGLVIVQAQAPALLPVPQSVAILGVGSPATTTNGSVIPYSNRPGDYIALYFAVPRDAAPGPRHLVFSFGDDLYVMPYGVNLVQKGPPVAQSASANADGTVAVAGAGFGGDSRVFFDGAQATGVVFSGSDAQGTLTATPPPGANGQSAQVTVYNSDGQNSTLIPGAPQPTYTYPATGTAPGVTLTPNAVPAGTLAMIDVNVTGMTLTDGQVTIGFGSDDVQARRVWVLSPTRALVNVWVAPNATTALSEVSVLSGMQVVSTPNAFQTLPGRAGAPVIAAVANPDPTIPTLMPGQFATIYGLNLSAAQITVNDVPANVVIANANQVNFIVPPTTAGPGTLRVTSSAGTALPVAMQIDATAPAILFASTTAASAGDTVQLTVAGVDAAAAARLRVTAAGIDMNVQQVAAAAGMAQVQSVLTQSFGSSSVPVIVWLDGTPSAPVNVTIR
jgi:uncharacterized protein (TIGR03437 family)